MKLIKEILIDTLIVICIAILGLPALLFIVIMYGLLYKT